MTVNIKSESFSEYVFYHILVDNIAKILPCDKTLSFV
jgi:hypothetical protein